MAKACVTNFRDDVTSNEADIIMYIQRNKHWIHTINLLSVAMLHEHLFFICKLN